MTIRKTLLGTGAAIAAIAAAAPASAQYYNYGYSQPTYRYAQPTYRYNQAYGYNYNQAYGYNQYGNQYGYAQPYAANTAMATQQCTAAVQNRLDVYTAQTAPVFDWYKKDGTKIAQVNAIGSVDDVTKRAIAALKGK